MASPPPPPPPPPPPAPPAKTYELTACSLSYTKPPMYFPFTGNTTSSNSDILRNVSFTAHPSEVLAIVGPSGAGKSSLLNLLSAHTLPSSGHLLLNSAPLRPSLYRKLISHVPQHDLSLPHLTLLETFLFTARLLRLPNPTVTVSDLLSDLSLSHLAHSRLSSPLSGGERRRVSIGLSLLSDPAILLLDEPTSGLDSASAFTIVKTLKRIAVSRQRTVILSIHQPGFKLLSVIDSVLLLSKGSLVHHGTIPSLESFLLSHGFHVPAQLNPLEFAMEILHELPPDDQTIDHHAAAALPPKTTSSSSSDELTTTMESHAPDHEYASSRLQEIATLHSRFWKIVYRSKELLLTNALEALLVGFLLGTIYIDVGYDKQGIDKRFGFFAFTLTFLLSSTTETLPTFVGERPILLRETSSGVYRLSSHLIANTLVFIPYLLAISSLYATSVYFIVGLCSNSWTAFANFVLIVWAVMLTANSFVLFVSSVAPNYISGTTVVAVSLAGFFLFSGYFLSKESMPVYWVFMHYMSPYKYALDAMLANEYGCERSRCFEWAEDGRSCELEGRDVLRRRGLWEGERLKNVEVLLGFFVLYRVLYWVVLSRRASSCKR